MLTTYYANQWEYWESNEKITIDPENLLIWVNPEVETLDIKSELYSGIKRIWQLPYPNVTYVNNLFPIRTIGGDATSGGKFAGDIYFMQNGWRVVLDPTTTRVTGVLYSDDYDTAWQVENSSGQLKSLYPNEVSNLVQSIEPDKANQEILAYGAGQVVVDFNKGSSGLKYPFGTYAKPVDTIRDAVAICNYYGFETIYIKEGSAVLSSETDLTNKTVISTKADYKLIFQSDATLGNCTFRGITIGGDTNGQRIYAESCVLDDIQNLNGTFLDCGLNGTMTLAAGQNTVFANCYSRIAGSANPVVDFLPVGDGSQLSMRNYSGGLAVRNMDHPADTATIEFSAGKCTIESSCVSGYISLRGIALLDDQSGSTTVDLSGSIQYMAAESVWNADTRTLTSIDATVNIDATTLDNISNAVWNKAIADMVTAGSAGERLKALLTVNKYLGLS